MTTKSDVKYKSEKMGLSLSDYQAERLSGIINEMIEKGFIDYLNYDSVILSIISIINK